MRRLVLCVLALLLAGCSGGDLPGRPDDKPPARRMAPGAVADGSVLGCPDDVHDKEQTAWDAGDATLAGPHYKLVARWAARTERLDYSDRAHLRVTDVDAADELGAADGEEFLLVCLESFAPLVPPSLSVGSAPDVGFTEAARGVNVRVGGRDLATRVATDRTPSGDVLFMVSVPKGEPAQLRVTDGGRTQSLDLATGRRGADATPGTYPVRTGKADGSQGVVVRAGQGKLLASADVDYDTVATSGYADGAGWAKDGRTWLLVRCTIRTQSDGGLTDLTVDVSRSFRVTMSEGATATAAPATVELGRKTVVVVAFDLPTSAGRSGEFAFDFIGTAAVGGATLPVRTAPTNTNRQQPVPFRLT